MVIAQSILMALLITSSVAASADESKRVLQSAGYNVEQPAQFENVANSVREKIAAVARSLLLPGEADRTLDVIILHEGSTDVFVYAQPSHSSIVVSEGLLRRISSDDELAILVADAMSEPVKKLAPGTSRRNSLKDRWTQRSAGQVDEVFNRMQKGSWSVTAYRDLKRLVVADETPSTASRLADAVIQRFDQALSQKKFSDGHVVNRTHRSELAKLSQESWLKTEAYRKSIEAETEAAISKIDRSTFAPHFDDLLKNGEAPSFRSLVGDQYALIERLQVQDPGSTFNHKLYSRIVARSLEGFAEKFAEFNRKNPELTYAQAEKLSNYAHKVETLEPASSALLDALRERDERGSATAKKEVAQLLSLFDQGPEFQKTMKLYQRLEKSREAAAKAKDYKKESSIRLAISKVSERFRATEIGVRKANEIASLHSAALGAAKTGIVKEIARVAAPYDVESAVQLLQRLPRAEREAANREAGALRMKNFEAALRSAENFAAREALLQNFTDPKVLKPLAGDSVQAQAEFYARSLLEMRKTVEAIDGRLAAGHWYTETVQHLFLSKYAGQSETVVTPNVAKKAFALVAAEYGDQLVAAVNYEAQRPRMNSDQLLLRLTDPTLDGELRSAMTPRQIESLQAKLKEAVSGAFDLHKTELAKNGFSYERRHQAAELNFRYDNLAHLIPDVTAMPTNELWQGTKELAAKKGGSFSPDLVRVVKRFGKDVSGEKIADAFAAGDAKPWRNESAPPELKAEANRIQEAILAKRQANVALPTDLNALLRGWRMESGALKQRYRAAAEKQLLDRHRELVKKFPDDQRAIAEHLFKDTDIRLLSSDSREFLTFLTKNRIIPKAPGDRLSFALGARELINMPEFLPKLLGENAGKAEFSKFRTADLITAYDQIVPVGNPSYFKDRLYVHLQSAVKSDPQLASRFKPQIRMILDQNLRRDAVIESVADRVPLLSDPTKPLLPGAAPLRDEAYVIGLALNKLAEDDPVRAEVAERFGTRYRTNVYENTFVSGFAEVTHSAPSLGGYVDYATRRPEDKMKMLEYLLGDDPLKHPAIFGDLKGAKPQFATRKQLESYHVKFRSANADTRAALLQPLFAGESGLLADPKTRDQVQTLILGPYKNKKVLNRMLSEYLESARPEDRKIIHGKFLASVVGEQGKSEISINKVLESMNAFGDRARQGVATSPWLSSSVREAASESFSKSHPPAREEIFRALEAAFGQETVGKMMSEPELIGSGSINFVVRVKMKNPTTGKLEDVAIRLQKSGVEGQIFNQNDIWARVTSNMMKDADPEIQRAGSYLDEIRDHSMKSLSAGGADLDQARERGMYSEVRSVYEQDAKANSSTGFRNHVMQPLDDFQSRYVKAEFSKTVSIFEYIPSVPLEDIDPKLRTALLSQAVDAEFRGIFQLGKFDKEPHPGNWLFDVEGQRMVRIDYANFTTISESSRVAMKDAFSLLLQPKLSAQDLAKLKLVLPTLFESEKLVRELIANADDDLLRRAISASDFPGFQEPGDRLIFLRRSIEEAAAKKAGRIQALRFTRDANSVLEALQKTALFRARLGSPQVAQILLRNLDLSAAKMAGSLLRSKVGSCALQFSRLRNN